MRFLTSVVMLLGLSLCASAVDYTWDGGNTAGYQWTAPTNWNLDAGAPTTTADRAIFNTTGTTKNPTVDVNIALDEFVVGGTTGWTWYRIGDITSLDMLTYGSSGSSTMNPAITGKRLLVTNGILTLNASNNFSDTVTFLAGSVVLGTSGQIGTNTPIHMDGFSVLTLNSSNNWYSSQTTTVDSVIGGTGTIELKYNGAPIPVSTNSSGVVSVNQVSYSYPLDLASIGMMYLGSTNLGTNTATSLGVGSDGNYRIGAGGGTIAFDSAGSDLGVFTGACNLVVGRNGGGVKYTGTAVLSDSNTFSGTIIVNRGSTLTGLAMTNNSGGSPFGATNGVVTLNSGVLKLSRGSATTIRQPVVKGAMNLTGGSTVYLDGNHATANVQITFDSITKDPIYDSALTIQYVSALGTKERFFVNTGDSYITNDAQGMINAMYVGLQGTTLYYPLTRSGASSPYELLTTNYTYTTGAASPFSNSIPTSIVLVSNAGGYSPELIYGQTITNWATAFAWNGHWNSSAGSTIVIQSGLLIYEYSGGPSFRSNLDFSLASQGRIVTMSGGTLNALGNITSPYLVKSGPGGLSLGSAAPGHTGINGKLLVSEGLVEFDQIGGADFFSNIPNATNLILTGGSIACTAGRCSFQTNITVIIGPTGGTITSGDYMSFYGKVTGPGLMCWNGLAGKELRFRGVGNDWSGGLYASLGIVTVYDGSSLGSGPIRMAAGTTLNVRTNLDISSLRGRGAVVIGNDVATGTKYLTVGSGNTDDNFPGVISDQASTRNGSLIKTGTGTMTLWGPNTFTGGTTINGGILAVTGFSLHDTGTVTVAGGTLSMIDSETVGNVTLNSGSITGNSTLTTGNLYLNQGTVDSILSTASNFVKNTSGTVTLNKANTFSGSAIITNGLLLVQGSIGAGTTLTNYMGTLGGTGTVYRHVEMMPGSYLTPGASIGTITVSNLNFEVGSTVDFELATTNASDFVQVNGLLGLGGNIRVVPSTGFGYGVYPLFGYTTITTNQAPRIITPAGYAGTLSTDDSAKKVYLTIGSDALRPVKSGTSLLLKSGKILLSK